MDTWEKLGVPNPGSKEAGEQGCTCAVIDNHRGLGVPATDWGGVDGRVFWITGGCPLHDKSDTEKTES